MKPTGTIAPKVRINIVYQQAGDQRAQVELPLKLLVMDNFGGKADPRMIEDRKPININKDNFSRVMEQNELRLDLAVADRVNPQSQGDLAVSMNFRKLSDFGPEAIVEQCPELHALMQLRSALSALKGPLGNVPAFRQRLRELMQDESGRKQLLEELFEQPALSQAQDASDSQGPNNLNTNTEEQ